MLIGLMLGMALQSHVNATSLLRILESPQRQFRISSAEAVTTTLQKPNYTIGLVGETGQNIPVSIAHTYALEGYHSWIVGSVPREVPLREQTYISLARKIL